MKQAFYISPDGRQGRKGYYFYDSNNGFVIENGYSNSRVKSAGSAGDTLHVISRQLLPSYVFLLKSSCLKGDSNLIFMKICFLMQAELH